MIAFLTRPRRRILGLLAFGCVAFWTGASTDLLRADPEIRAVLHDDAAGWLLVEIGALDLPAYSSHHDVRQPPVSVVTFPRDGFVHGFEVEMVDASGRAISPRVLHHVNLIIPEERELFSEIMLRLGAAGPETGRVMLPRLLAYPVSEGDSLIVTAMFHNPEPEPFEAVRLRLRLRFTSPRWVRPFAVRPLYLDVMPPDSRHAFDLPPGRTEVSWEGRPAIPGRILGLGGHLHKHGVLLRLEDVTADRVLWEARPELDSAGNVIGMPVSRFFHRFGVRLRPEHVYRLTAIYENDTGELIPEGGMGAVGGVFLPARGVSWPAPNRAHPQYLRDRALVAESHPAEAHDATRHSRGGHQHHRREH